MGTKIHCKSYLPGYCYSMRDLNEDSSSSSWPLFYGDKTVTNGQYYNGFIPSGLVDGYSGHDKDALKQKMLEHEAIFKNQVCELHRLYRIQRDMMEEVKRKEFHTHRASMEPSSSSSLHGSHVPSEDARKWHMAGFPLTNSGYGKTGVDIINSPMSCTKGYNNTRAGQFRFHNGSTSKDLEALESRPLKVRKKLFDLQLPADDYIDPEEGEKVGLADLNEPVWMEEAAAPSSVDFLGRTDVKGINQPTKPGHLGVTRESNGFLTNSSVESHINDKGRLSQIYEAGSKKNSLSFVTQSREPDKLSISSYPVQGMVNQVHHPPGIYPPNCSNSHLEPTASQTPGYPFFSSSSFPSSGAQSVLQWEKPIAQKMTTLEPSLNSASEMSRNLHFARSQEPFGGKWLANGSSRIMNGFYHGSASGSKELPSAFDYRNCHTGDNPKHGFEHFQKSSYRAESKPAIDINLNEVVSKSFSDEIQDLNMIDDGKNKHEVIPPGLPWLKHKPDCANETVRDLNQVFTPKVVLGPSNCDKKDFGETQNVKKILGIPIFETVAPENGPSTSASHDCQSKDNKVNNERKNNRMIDINLECEPDDEIAAETTMEKQENGPAIRGLIDLNSLVSECEDPPAPSYESKSEIVKTTLEIDLEVPVFMESEDDDLNMPAEVNVPQPLENRIEQSEDEILRDAAETILSISSCCPQRHVDDGICHSSETSLAELLLWFVDVCVNELEGTSGKESRSNGSQVEQEVLEEIDDFEAMTLQLAETKEEDYMPKPLCPEVPKVDEDIGANTLQTRPRRGQSRRGRQRRDFQRDILPGLASLSRHEVTEDIQTFGGLMRATGHSWSSGLTRRNGTRNGGGRGRRRAVVVETGPAIVPSPVCTPISNIEAGLEDRSLTGWGKTTRRPRRQRCGPAGNSTPTAVLT